MKLSGIVRLTFSAAMIAKGLAAARRPRETEAEAPSKFPDYETMERVTEEPADYLQDAEIDARAPAVVQQQRRSAIQRMQERFRKLRTTR